MPLGDGADDDTRAIPSAFARAARQTSSPRDSCPFGGDALQRSQFAAGIEAVFAADAVGAGIGAHGSCPRPLRVASNSSFLAGNRKH